MKRTVFVIAILALLGLSACASNPKPCTNDFTSGFFSNPCGEKRPVNRIF